MKPMIAVLVICSLAHAQQIHILFAGLPQKAKPTFTKRYDTYVREGLTTAEDASLVDYAETVRLADKIGLWNYPTVSQSLIESLESFSADSTLIVWARVEKYSVVPKRCCFFGARAVGNVSVIITMYSLNKARYMFTGVGTGNARVRLRPVWFRRVEEVSHIGADDLDKIAGEMSRQVADKTISIIKAVARSILAEGGEIYTATPEAQEEEAPSLYDVFEIPSAEAPEIEHQEPSEQVVEEPAAEEAPAEEIPAAQEAPPAQE